MNKGLTIFLILAVTGAGVYLYYRSQKKAKPLITIPALTPAVATTPTWVEALKAIVAPAPTYEAPAPKYEPGWWGIPGGGVPSK